MERISLDMFSLPIQPRTMPLPFIFPVDACNHQMLILIQLHPPDDQHPLKITRSSYSCEKYSNLQIVIPHFL